MSGTHTATRDFASQLAGCKYMLLKCLGELRSSEKAITSNFLSVGRSSVMNTTLHTRARSMAKFTVKNQLCVSD